MNRANSLIVVGVEGASGTPATFTGERFAAPRLIGLAGRAGVGKDTLAKWISHRYGHMHTAYADPLREILNKRFGWRPDLWLDRAWKEQVMHKNECGPFSPRSWIQWLGTDILREYAGEDIFIKLAFSRWDRKPFPMIISDVRFDNEARAIVDRGGCVIELRREAASAVAPHVSERGVDPKWIDAVLSNDGTYSELYAAGRTLVESIGARFDMQYELDLRGPQP